jgi:zinc transport system permease protein
MAFGGIGLAFSLGAPVLPTVVGFTFLSSLFMGWVTRRHKERADTVIGVLWATGMAFGIILLDLTPGYHVDLMSYLFGSILTVPDSDLWIILGLDLSVFCIVLYFFKDLLAMSFEAEFARTRGVPVDVLYFVLLAMIAASVVMIIQVVGLILVIALLTIPPYIAERQVSSLGLMMIVATFWSMSFCFVGLMLSYVFDVTSGAAIIVTAAAGFLATLAYERAWHHLRRARTH